MMILKLEARGAGDLSVCSHRPRLIQTRKANECSGCNFGVVVKLWSGEPWKAKLGETIHIISFAVYATKFVCKVAGE